MEQEVLVAHPINIVDHIEYSAGSVVSKTLLKKPTGTLTLFSFDSGQGLSEHSAPFNAVVQILDGEAEVTISGTTICTVAGQVLIIPANAPHSLQARQRFKMLLTMIRS